MSLPLTSVDFYRDADGDGKFKAEKDQYLGRTGRQGRLLASKSRPQRVPAGAAELLRGGRGHGGQRHGASPEEMVKAADDLEKAAEAEAGRQGCEAGKEQGLPAEQCKGLTGDQGEVAKTAQKVAEKIGKAARKSASC